MPCDFVVGGSMGIGFAIARKLAARGDDVAIFARREAALAAAAAELVAVRRSPAQRVAFWSLDVADGPAVATVLGRAIAELGPPDLLVNCAGRAIPKRFEDVTADELEATLRTNLVGSWRTIQAVLPHMRRRGSGHLVNTASLAGLIGVFGYADYCASKFALVGLSEVLRSELRPDGIGVSVLCPPDVDTPGFAEENRHKPPETEAVSRGASLLGADAVADALVAGIARGRFLIVPGRDARIAHWAKRLAPRFVTGVMDRQIRRARRTR
jgi:3-dehydrosphinganine reductase